ncbi:N-acetyltransferase [uncultured Methanobrevibacter sp.]|uniref:N-acetyltransferase n=1 Tax=uncultured Methanobrevibacter sp. TaxID=253161 RepID=UPI0025F08A94|nr:N-acetyltransferase [uncultured Methanobrevibacter sp.]
MEIEYIKNNYKFETLSEEHDLSDFECESEDLNDFLKNDALKQQKEKLNLTKLITCDGEIIGFVSLLTDSIKLKIINENAVKITIKNKLNISENNRIPAIKIGRFAISKKYAKKGLGSHILKSIILNIKNIAETEVGLRFIIVEGYASAYTFYVNHNNFHSLKKDENEIKKLDKIIQQNPERTFDLYLDLKD